MSTSPASRRRRRGAGAARQSDAPRARSSPTVRPAHSLYGAVAVATLAIAGAAALYVHAVFLTHAGPLWRDEVNTAAYADMPSLQSIWTRLRYDSVPLAATLLVRAWRRVAPGSDASLRWLGCGLGCATLVALWWNARRSQVVLPVCTILLFAFNVWVIRSADAVRPTGLGTLFVVLTFAALAAALREPRPWRIAVAALCSVLAVQSVYANVPLVGGICLAGVAVGIAARSRARVALSVGVGALAAVSLLPYLPAIGAGREWVIVVQSQADLMRWWQTLGSTAAWESWAWALLAAAGLAVAAVRVVGRPSPPPGDVDRERTLYAAVALVVGSLGFVALVVWSRLVTQPWYYVPLMALWAACLDVLLGSVVRRPAAGLAVAAALVAATAAHLVAVPPMLRFRQTSLDLIAARLRESAAAGDLVIVSPWYYGVTFHRYYTGAARWLTIPPLEDSSIHRYDLLKRRMQDPAAMDSALREIADTLQAGKRVWLVGGLLGEEEPEAAPHPPPPAPAPDLGWNGEAYSARWGALVFALLRDHVIKLESIPLAAADPVSPYENPPLFVIEGWH